MSATVVSRPAFAGPFRWLGRHAVLLFALLVLLYMFLPVFVVMLMSFNQPASRLGYNFDGFTLDNWTNVCGPYQLCSSVWVSIRIGLAATLLATALGTLMAFAMVRHRFRGRASANLLIFLPMATPEIVLGSSLLALFVNQGLAGKLGFWTIFVAHVMFCLSFVVVTVKARLAGMDPRLEQAAMDLYANEWQTFWRVTFPLVFPGILSAALLSFSLSFDDFIITNLNAGQTVTFPMFVWGAAQRGVPMQVNVIGTVMFLVAFGLVLAGELRNRRQAKALAR
jgi:spermidine/putrescine transport system permease protein